MLEKEIAELEAIAGRISPQLAFEWKEFGGPIAHHEACHAVLSWTLGAEVRDVSIGPATYQLGGGDDVIGFVRFLDCSKLDMLAKVVIYVAGELGMSAYENRPFNFKHSTARGDRKLVTELLQSADVEAVPLFQLAVQRARQLLSRYSLPISTLTLQLRRELCFDKTEFESLMERMSVARI